MMSRGQIQAEIQKINGELSRLRALPNNTESTALAIRGKMKILHALENVLPQARNVSYRQIEPEGFIRKRDEKGRFI